LVSAASDFVIWQARIVPQACVLNKLIGVDNEFELNDGITRAANFPPSAGFQMDPDKPRWTLLVDNVFNVCMLLVGSQRLKEFLESRGIVKMEYLPVGIINHKRKRAPESYFILHPIDPVECLDINRSGVTWSQIDNQIINEVRHLAIDASKIPADRMIFRPRYFSDVVLVRRELAVAIDQEDFTGIRWVELADYPEH
jgi:uncharacterized protein DUF1629